MYNIFNLHITLINNNNNNNFEIPGEGGGGSAPLAGAHAPS